MEWCVIYFQNVHNIISFCCHICHNIFNVIQKLVIVEIFSMISTNHLFFFKTKKKEKSVHLSVSHENMSRRFVKSVLQKCVTKNVTENVSVCLLRKHAIRNFPKMCLICVLHVFVNRKTWKNICVSVCDDNLFQKYSQGKTMCANQ